MGGTVYGAESIGSIKISKAADGIGLSGVVTSSLNAEIWAPDVVTLPEFSEIVIGGFELPTFYLSSLEQDGGILKITAYDACRRLSLPFDYTSFTNGGNVSLIMGAIANQAGFSGAAAPQRITSLNAENVKEKSMLEICESLSSVNAGIFYCNPDNVLSFCAAGTYSSATSATEQGDIKKYIEKNISRLLIDGKDNSTFDIGSGGYDKAVKISGNLIDAAAANAIASQLFADGGAFKYNAFEAAAVISGNIDPCGQLFWGEDIFRATSILIDLCALGAVAQLSAAPVDSSALEYTEYYRREIKNRVEYNVKCGFIRYDPQKGIVFEGNEEEEENA